MDNRTWAEIRLENIKNNYENIKNNTNAKVMCIIKADAYGHGIIKVAKTLSSAFYFGVATASEAMLLRENGIKNDILILGFCGQDISQIIENDITMTVFDLTTAENISKTAKSLGKIAKIHIKIDTGMSRLGFLDSYDIKPIFALDNIYVEGIYSHFCVADDLSRTDFTLNQADIFKKIIKSLEDDGIFIKLKHICASSGILEHKDLHFDMVRAGILLYGYYPSKFVSKHIKITPAMSVFCKVAQVKTLKKGQCVSYGLNFTATYDTKIAIVTIGYADGYSRLNSNCSFMLQNNAVCNVLGTVCMDMCMIEVNDFTSPFDDILVFGIEDNLNADTIANFTNTVSYEVLCNISARVLKKYI